MSSIRFWMAGLASASLGTRFDCILRTGCPRWQTFRIDIVSGLAGLVELLAEGMLESGAPVVDHLGNNGHCDFFRQHRPDIQSDGHVHAFEAFPRNSFGCELLGNGTDLSLASNHSDVTGVGLNSPAQNVLIFLMTARNDDDVRVLVRDDLLERLIETFRVNGFRFGKALRVGIDRTVIDNRGLESGDCRNFGNLCRNMPRPEDDYFRSRQDRLDENFDLPAADKTAFGHGFVGQVEGHDAGLFVLDHILRGGPNLGFDTSAADRPHNRSVVSNEHLGGLEAGHRPAYLHDCSERGLAPLLAQTLNFIKNVNLHKAFSLTYLLTLLVPLS